MSELSTDLRAKVLIAEDDAIVALDLQGMVMRLGYDVVSIVESGTAAIASAKRFQPDIILLDMVLSGSMDGIDVAREIQKDFDVPVVFCISSADLTVLGRAKEITYAGYLLKPINPDSLATTLDTALYKYKLEKRVRNAEVKFRKLADTSGIVRFFMEHEAAWAWDQTGTADPVVSNFPDTIPSAELSDFMRKASVACRASESGKTAFCAELAATGEEKLLVALISLHNKETNTVSGIAIPLLGLS